MFKWLKRYNAILVLASVVLAAFLGVAVPHFFAEIKFIGEIFINLLKLFALPLIASTLVATLGNLGSDLGKLRSMIQGVTGYMLLSEIIAVAIALLLFNLFDAGKTMDPQLILHGEAYAANQLGPLNLPHFLLAIFPQNIFESLAKFDLLPVLIFSTMFGIGCALVGERAQLIIRGCTALRDVSNICLQGVMLISPVGIFALVGSGIAAANSDGNLEGSFSALIAFVTILTGGLLLHAAWQLILVLITNRTPLRTILKANIAVFSTAFATSSSVATLPVALQATDHLGANPSVARFMLPLCASINVGGMMMYEVAAALFFSQVLGVELSWSQQLLVAIASILGGMAEGGIPESSLVSLVVVFRIVNVPLNAISILLPLDRLIDRLRTVVNIFGNICGVVVVSRWLRTEQR